MSTEQHRPASGLVAPRTRRAAIQTGGALLAGLGAISERRTVVAQGTPVAGEGGGHVLLAQGFSQGSLFPTQGDAGVLPYTVILWDAADRGFFFVDADGGAVGIVGTETVTAAIEAGERPLAILAAPSGTTGSAETAETFWALRLGYGAPGSDPDAVTYQGEPIAASEAALLGPSPPELPEGPLDLGAGYLIITGLSGFDAGTAGLTLRLR